MKRPFRVRFAPQKKIKGVVETETPANPPAPSPRPTAFSNESSSRATRQKHTKSKLGCKECKLRRVKCDQTHPVCLRCQRRGSVCYSETPSSPWQVLIPAMLSKSLADPWMGEVEPDRRLLQYWLEKTSRMLTVSPEDNPLAYPLLEHLVSTPSLLHAVQSISAGQEHFFSQSSLTTCLQERGLAIRSLRHEMRDATMVTPASLLAVFLQGVSWSWTEEHTKDYGKEHLLAARGLLETMLQDEEKRKHPLVQFMLGWYLYWDMSCAFIADPSDLTPLNTSLVFDAIQASRDSFHPMIGFSSELMYLIACLGRHCRTVLDTGTRDPALEATLEEQLLLWDPEHEDGPLKDMSMAYRNHGLIMLYNICGFPNQDGDFMALAATAMDEDMASTMFPNNEGRIRELALDTLERLFRCPINAPTFNFHSTPLLTAASELTSDDADLRIAAINHFKAIYSTNRVAVNMWAIDLLRELWDFKDCGISFTWLELLTAKDWTLTFA